MPNTPVVIAPSRQNPVISAMVEITFGTLDKAEMERLYQSALNADIAWSRELRRIYGRRAGDARYDHRGVSTPELRNLYAQKVTADNIWRAAMSASRKPLQSRHQAAA